LAGADRTIAHSIAGETMAELRARGPTVSMLYRINRLAFAAAAAARERGAADYGPCNERDRGRGCSR
jgi:hypothetical protein